jgi:outer membrane protein OmpA-like peptidoglycan-associated protein
MRILAVTALVLMLAGCDRGRQDSSQPVQDNATASPEPAAGRQVADAAFDIESVPMSTKEMGAFPFFSIPEGYSSQGYGKFNKDFARFPFWVNDQAVWVEGQFYGTSFIPVGDKDMSEFEVKRNFESAITQLGGVKLSEGKIPGDAIKAWGDEITMGFIDGLGDIYNNAVTTYVIRREDGNVWVHLTTNNAQAHYIVGKEKSFKQTATLLPADKLKQAIDRDGKVVVEVNFATDASEILPGSRPQLDAIAVLLRNNSVMRLAINGHTDGTGDAARNQALSARRAASVKQSLVDAGIADGRLTAAGLGSSQPVAGNDSEDGKARNRRVELVRL